MITLERQTSGESLVVHYVTDGPRTAAAIIRGESRLVGMVLADGASEPEHVVENLAGALEAVNHRPRIYHDARLARTVESFGGLPMTGNYDDTRVMMRLLGEEPPPELEKGGPMSVEAAKSQAIKIHSLYIEHQPQIDALGLTSCYRELELPVIDPTLVMIANGVRICYADLEDMVAGYGAAADIARHQLDEYAGQRFNPNSPEDVRQLQRARRSPSEPATMLNMYPPVATTELEKVRHTDPAVDAILRSREATPLHRSAQELLDAANQNTGLVHANFDPLGTDTGRFACTDPPLQALAEPFKSVVVAGPGNVLMEADINQTELRVLAHFSRDPYLLEAFEQGIDVHRHTAAKIYQTTPEKVTPDQRKTGKALNFAMIFGQREEGLMEQLDISHAAATDLIDSYFQNYSGVGAWIDEVCSTAEQEATVRTLAGRLRWLPGFLSGDPAAICKARRQAVNAIIQGSAADLMKAILIDLTNNKLPPGATLRLTVHDSVLLELPENMVPETAAVVRQIMVTPRFGLSVPLEVDISTGATWADCKA